MRLLVLDHIRPSLSRNAVFRILKETSYGMCRVCATQNQNKISPALITYREGEKVESILLFARRKLKMREKKRAV